MSPICDRKELLHDPILQRAVHHLDASRRLAGVGAEDRSRCSQLRKHVHLTPDYNIASSTFQPLIRSVPEDGEREVVLMRWGLLPAKAAVPDGVKISRPVPLRSSGRLLAFQFWKYAQPQLCRTERHQGYALNIVACFMSDWVGKRRGKSLVWLFRIRLEVPTREPLCRHGHYGQSIGPRPSRGFQIPRRLSLLDLNLRADFGGIERNSVIPISDGICFPSGEILA